MEQPEDGHPADGTDDRSLSAGKDHLPRAVERLVRKLGQQDSVQHVCRYPLPREQTVIRILNLLAEALFPGYFGRKGLTSANLAFHLGETLSNAYDLLAGEISRCALHARHDADGSGRLECEREGQERAFELLEDLPDLLDILDGDVRAAFEGDPAATGYDEVIFCYPGFRAVMIYRIAHVLHSNGVPWLPRIMTEHAHRITGIDIHPGAQIGRRFFIDHGTGVVIGETSRIGDDVRMYQGVTLGGYRFKTDEEGDLVRGYKRHPTIEDDVIIYANASILGDITVGAGSVIGANVFLTHSVEPGTRVTIEKPSHRITRPEND